jgi:hypothetical protein
MYTQEKKKKQKSHKKSTLTAIEYDKTTDNTTGFRKSSTDSNAKHTVRTAQAIFWHSRKSMHLSETNMAPRRESHASAYAN